MHLHAELGVKAAEVRHVVPRQRSAELRAEACVARVYAVLHSLRPVDDAECDRAQTRPSGASTRIVEGTPHTARGTGCT